MLVKVQRPFIAKAESKESVLDVCPGSEAYSDSSETSIQVLVLNNTHFFVIDHT